MAVSWALAGPCWAVLSLPGCRAVKREQKGKEKRGKAWKERIAKQDAERDSKQQRC